MMMLIKTCAAIVLALQVSPAWSQSVPPAGHGEQHRAQAAKPTQSSPKSGLPAKAVTAGGLYDAPFADYRSFAADQTLKGWRAANDEVREAGGHIGVVKSLEAAKSAPPTQGTKP